MGEKIYKLQNKNNGLFYRYSNEAPYRSIVSEEKASVFKSLHSSRDKLEDMYVNSSLDATQDFNYLDFDIVCYEITAVTPSLSDEKGIFRLIDKVSGQYLAIWAKPGIKYSLQKKGKDWKTKKSCDKALLEIKKLKGSISLNPDDLEVVVFKEVVVEKYDYDNVGMSPWMKKMAKLQGLI